MEAPPRRIAPTEAPQETLSSEPAPAPHGSDCGSDDIALRKRDGLRR
jgi:hypothetical protein